MGGNYLSAAILALMFSSALCASDVQDKINLPEEKALITTATLIAAMVPDECGKIELTRNNRHGMLTSHGRFGKCTYPTNFTCEWIIHSIVRPNGTIDKNARIEFYYDDYEMPFDAYPCDKSRSYVRFFAINYPHKALVSHCHGRRIPEKFTWHAQSARVLLQTNELDAKGFRLRWNVFRRCTNDPNEWKCKDGSCIESQFRCDGLSGEAFDCPDGSDEVGCEPQICSRDQFQCKNKMKCINKDQKCNGYTDCRDGSDEENCPTKKCKPNEYRCKNRVQCYNDQQRCNGKTDCGDNSDESDEHCGFGICKADEVFCDRKLSCYKKKKKCDGVKDCSDGSDEAHCETVKCSGVKKNLCNHTFSCYTDLQRCDGINDCGDESDEWNCEKKKCDYHLEVACDKSFKCFRLDLPCDSSNKPKVPHCTDGKDVEHCELKGKLREYT